MPKKFLGLQLFRLLVGIGCISEILGFIAIMSYILDYQFLQFINVLCTQLHISDRLRAFLYAIIALSNNLDSQAQIHIRFSDLQQSLADFSTDAEKKHITQAQLLKLFYLLEGVQEKLKISLIRFKLELDETGDNDTVLVTLDILNRYTDVTNYINSKLDGELSIDTLVVAVNELFPNSLENCVVERRYQPTYAKTKRKLEKFPCLFSELVELGKTEGIDIDEIQREMTEIAAKINTDVVLACKELEKWDEQQREILKKEQEKQILRNQQFSLNINNINNENASDTDNNTNQHSVKEHVQELKQQYQQPAPGWYHLASNSIDKNSKNNKNNDSNNKQTDKNNVNNIRINSINNDINSNNLNNNSIGSSYVNHYT